MLPGIDRRTLTWGERSLLAEFSLKKGAQLPWHDHPHEQIGYLVSGCLLLQVGEERFEARPGDSWAVPPGVTHKADAREDCIAVEVFTPRREDYLPGSGQ